MSEPEQQAQPDEGRQRAAEVFPLHPEITVSDIGRNETVKALRGAFELGWRQSLAARVAGCPDPGSREPWTGRRLFEFFEHEAERGRGWPRLIKLGKVHWENLAARIESEIAAAGCPDEGQRQEQAEEREARDEWREIRRLERERDEWKDALKRENARLVDERDAARSIALGVAPRAALGAVAASPDERWSDGKCAKHGWLVDGTCPGCETEDAPVAGPADEGLREAGRLALIELEPEGGTDPWRDTVIRRLRAALDAAAGCLPEGGGKP